MSDIRSFEIDLDLKQNILVTLPCKQLDNLNIKFNIWNNGQVADINNYKCRLKALKSDYTPLIQNTDISISGNIVTVEADEQLTTTSGMVKTELQFIDKTTGKKKSSFNLNIKVVSGALEVDRTISKATITLLEQLDNKLDQIEDIEAVVEEAKIVKDELVTKTNEANTIKNELEAATTNAENKENEINTAVTNANNKIEEVNISISNANASKEALDTSKKNADTLKESLDESIDIGNTLKTNLDEANSLATNNKTALDNSNQNATNTKNELEELNSNATNIKNELDNSNSLATTNKSELDKANNLAQTNKTALDEANTLAEHNIEELNKLGDVTELAKQVETNKTDIASINNKIGTTELTTTDKTITGAIEEVKEIADNNTTQLNASMKIRELPNNFNNDMNNLLETGIYHTVFTSAIANEPFTEDSGGRRVTIEVVNISPTDAFQRIWYNDGVNAGHIYERCVNSQREWGELYSSTTIRHKGIVVEGNGTNKVRVLLDGEKIKHDIFVVNANPLANDAIVVGTSMINNQQDVEITLNKEISSPIQLGILYFV
ncbi:hypothetical protein CNEO2_190082 [Clostridium neonatale]|uniref:hypothetical protein n=1 Tax=Clostridium neonatale TaxID=137838 RepID=UPI00291BEDEA|nr:hypothetical protein [Clostridium neonatale]CAI3227083.1 hypothetical protein CNEO2_190082 [Clostridium neonatale]